MQHIVNAGFQHARQSCYLCLEPHDGVDTEVQIDYEGVLFICKGCCRALALTAGFTVDKDRQPEIDKLQAELDDAAEARNTAEYIVIELERASKDLHHKRMARVRASKTKETVGADG